MSARGNMAQPGEARCAAEARRTGLQCSMRAEIGLLCRSHHTNGYTAYSEKDQIDPRVAERARAVMEDE